MDVLDVVQRASGRQNFPLLPAGSPTAEGVTEAAPGDDEADQGVRRE